MYPNYDDFRCQTKIERVNLDVLAKELIQQNKGFRITSGHKNIKKEIKNPDSIFSSRFGRSLDDVNKFGNRYKCSCGKTMYRINNGTICPHCGTPVKYVDDDFEYMGFLILDDFYIIHPNLYKSIQYFIGAKIFDNIIRYEDIKDRDGFSIVDTSKRTEDEPYYGIGLIAFKEKFIEIMDFYLVKNKYKKQKYYDDIMLHIDKVFTHTIPVFTTLLRAVKNDPNVLKYEPTNATYMIMASLVNNLNQPTTKRLKNPKPKAELLYNLQLKFDELYDMIVQLLSGKKGKLRMVFGGRYNFTTRNVIVPNAKLRIDEMILPYYAMVELLKQRIINVLEKVYNSATIANKIYEESLRKKSPEVVAIIKQLIKDDPSGRGIPCLLNRNPTINYGSILQMFVIDICDAYTLQLPLQINTLLAADYDGDCLTVHQIIAKGFYEQAYLIFNPRNAMYISRNDGMTNGAVLPYKDIVINANTLLDIFKEGYTQDQLNNINAFKQKYKCEF